jgi:HPt (histidine-containing phosphotransfer) domain-containing protein
MPVMDGFEATSSIRATQRVLPIIAITADAMPSDRARCLSVGMNDYLSKPVELALLAELLAKWLPAPGAPEAQPPAESTEPETKAVFKPEVLLERLMGDRELASIALRSFLHDAPAQLDHLRRRLAEADAPGMRAQAHTLKGAAATVAAEDLRAIALALERAGTAGQLGLCGELLPRAVEEFERFKSALERSRWLQP